MTRHGPWVAGGLAWAVGVLVTARPPSEGAGWRFAFVAFALAGCVWVWLALRAWRPSTRSVLVLAVALRAVVFPLEPALSDDGYRYVWDGVVQAQEGISPYALRPSHPALAGRHGDVVYQRINSPEYYSVYPPLSQAAFALAGAVYGAGWRASWFLLKGLFVLAELVGIVLLVRVVGPSRAALYAWHPLAVVEVAGQGHTEGILVGALGVLLWATARRPGLAGAAVAAAGWVKLYPFALGAVVARWGGGRALAAAVFTGAVLAVPYASGEALTHVATSLGLYAGVFDFYSAPYLVLKSLLYHRVADPGGIAAGVMTLVWVGAVVAVGATNDGSPGRASLAVCAVVVAFAVTSPTLHPWHFLAALFCIPLLYLKWLKWLVSVSVVSYLTYVWPPGYTASLWLGWGGAAVVWAASRRALEPLLRYRGWGKWRRIRPHLGPLRPGARVLDLGAGEGYVADAAATDCGVAVTATDVVSYGRVDRRVDLYDGTTLPYRSGQFEAVIVVFVLHHSADPAAVLREAARVSSGVVVVLETVWTASWQKAWLERLDRLVNRTRSGAAIDEAPLDIRSDPEWREAFDELGLRLVRARTWGGPHPQALYVLEGHGATALRTLSTEAVRASSHTASS